MNTYSLTEAEILSPIGKAAIDHVTGDDIVVLIGIGQAIKDGDTTVEIAFKGGKTEVPKVLLEDLQKLYDAKKESLSKEEIANIDRIIKAKEVNSYAKVMTLLENHTPMEVITHIINHFKLT